MKVRVNKKFSDKYTGEIYKAGIKIELSEKRVEEIQKKDANLIQVLKEEARAISHEEDKEVLASLKKQAKEKKIPGYTKMTEEELIEALSKFNGGE